MLLWQPCIWCIIGVVVLLMRESLSCWRQRVLVVRSAVGLKSVSVALPLSPLAPLPCVSVVSLISVCTKRVCVRW